MAARVGEHPNIRQAGSRSREQIRLTPRCPVRGASVEGGSVNGDRTAALMSPRSFASCLPPRRAAAPLLHALLRMRERDIAAPPPNADVSTEMRAAHQGQKTHHSFCAFPFPSAKPHAEAAGNLWAGLQESGGRQSPRAPCPPRFHRRKAVNMGLAASPAPSHRRRRRSSRSSSSSSSSRGNSRRTRRVTAGSTRARTSNCSGACTSGAP